MRLDHLGPERRRQRRRVALDHQVDVGAAPSQQQVAHGTADQVDGIGRRRGDRRPAPGRRRRAPPPVPLRSFIARRPSSLPPYDDPRRGCRATGTTTRGCRRCAPSGLPAAAGRAAARSCAGGWSPRLDRRRGRRGDHRAQLRHKGTTAPARRSRTRPRPRKSRTRPRRSRPDRARSPTPPRRPTGTPTAARCRSSSTTISAAPPEGAPYPELFVGRDDFAKQMDWLEERGYEAVTLEQVQEAWYHGGKLPPKPIVISFDDGYRPQFTFALPTLRNTAGRASSTSGPKARTSTNRTSRR